jgi:hypothetical protein
MTTTPEAAAPLPLKGAPLADRQSRIRGGRLVGGARVVLRQAASSDSDPLRTSQLSLR